jgi:hypothetical protein
MSDQFDELLSRYAVRQLKPEEEKLLLEAAIDDDAAFGKLADEEMFRVLLEDEESRAMLLRATAPEPVYRRIFHRLMKSRPAWGLAVAATAVLIAVVIPKRSDSLATLSALKALPSAATATASQLADGKAIGQMSLEIVPNQQSYRAGDPLYLTIHSSEDADLALLAISPDGTVRLLFPNQWQSSAETPAGKTRVPPTPNPGFRLDGGPGRIRLILAAFPRGTGAVGQLRSSGSAPPSLAVTSTEIEILPK